MSSILTVHFGHHCWPCLKTKNQRNERLWIFHLRGENLSKPSSEKKVKFDMCSDTLMAGIFGKYVYHCSGIDPFFTLMGNFDWGPISRNNIVSIENKRVQQAGV